MKEIDYSKKVSKATLINNPSTWRTMIRCDTPSGASDVINKFVADNYPAKLIYAEGDSWFDKFTPLFNSQTNLLQKILLPYKTVVVDVSTVGDESRSMVGGWQARITKPLFDFYGFNAILLSAGGNDLKNLFADRIRHLNVSGPLSAAAIDNMCRPNEYAGYFQSVISNIKAFVKLRDNADNDVTRAAPILLHGYDYFQPRLAKAKIVSGGSFGRGPWLYHVLSKAGFSGAQMRAAADAVVDQLNTMLADEISILPGVHVIDSRGVLIPAVAGTTTESAHWLDEIHPNGTGFEKLASYSWNQPLATLLGYQFAPHELDDVGEPVALSQARPNNPMIVTA